MELDFCLIFAPPEVQRGLDNGRALQELLQQAAARYVKALSGAASDDTETGWRLTISAGITLPPCSSEKAVPTSECRAVAHITRSVAV